MNIVLSVVTAVAACAAALSAALISRRAAKLKAEMAAARVEASLKLAEASTPLKPGKYVPEYKIKVPRLRGMRVDIYLGGVPRPASRSRSASGLTRIAASVLPASERDRYAEEFTAELHDLAQSGRGRLRQMMYGLRVIIRTIPLHFALRAPRRESATP